MEMFEPSGEGSGSGGGVINDAQYSAELNSVHREGRKNAFSMGEIEG